MQCNVVWCGAVCRLSPWARSQVNVILVPRIYFCSLDRIISFFLLHKRHPRPSYPFLSSLFSIFFPRLFPRLPFTSLHYPLSTISDFSFPLHFQFKSRLEGLLKYKRTPIDIPTTPTMSGFFSTSQVASHNSEVHPHSGALPFFHRQNKKQSRQSTHRCY